MHPSFAGFSGNSFYHVLPIDKRPRPFPPLRRPSITTTLFSPRPVKVRRPSSPLTSKPIYTTVGQRPQSSNQKIEIENFSHTASLLRGNGKLLEFYGDCNLGLRNLVLVPFSILKMTFFHETIWLSDNFFLSIHMVWTYLERKSSLVTLTSLSGFDKSQHLNFKTISTQSS